MRENKKKSILVLLVFLTIISIGVSSYAHSGRTDSSGGHRDNKNKSGLGSYHYHCGGHPAHLHKNGVCPYSSSASSNKKKSTSSSKENTRSKSVSSKTTNSNKTSAVDVKGIEINETVTSLKEVESKKLTATVEPSNATNKEITWKSSNNSIATVNSSGEVTANKEGNVWITAESLNGKGSTIKINVKKEAKHESSTVAQAQIRNSNSAASDRDESNLAGGIVALGILGGGTYLGYRQYKKKK